MLDNQTPVCGRLSLGTGVGSVSRKTVFGWIISEDFVDKKGEPIHCTFRFEDIKGGLQFVDISEPTLDRLCHNEFSFIPVMSDNGHYRATEVYIHSGCENEDHQKFLKSKAEKERADAEHTAQIRAKNLSKSPQP